MAELIRATIVFVLSNFSLSFLVIGLLFALAAVARAPKPLRSHDAIERLLAWHVFWSIGVCNLYNFVMHGFFGKMSAAFIGWADSPFQFEVATASLGFSVVGFLAAFRSFDLRLAAILGPSVFSLGAAIGHIYQMLTQHKFAAGNAGVVFYTDILIPVFGGVLLWMWWRSRTDTSSAANDFLAMPQDDGEFLREPVRMRDLCDVTDRSCDVLRAERTDAPS